MSQAALPELWTWGEYYCPWTYVATVRLHAVAPEYRGRVRLRLRPFPLELIDGSSAPRDILSQEWWLAAIQEPAAAFAPYRSADWPTTTMPAFEGAWCAERQGDEAFAEYDRRIRRAFFAESRNIGRRETVLAVAAAAGLDMPRFRRDFTGDDAREAVLAEARLGRERYHVEGTPTTMLPDDTQLPHALAEPDFDDRIVVGVSPLPCCGEACLESVRAMFEQALKQGVDAT
ncbi:MAG TPA: DsbA family protein [Thermomicrobiales bacterium]|nr:DsbA family protein [Thermomicrobiales bacterium]